MKWIKTEDKLPELNKQVLLWTRLGHRLDYEIGSLMEVNGIPSVATLEERAENKKYPNILEWNVNGHWIWFEKTTHWAELPSEPND
jgi:hypothetical protein